MLKLFEQNIIISANNKTPPLPMPMQKKATDLKMSEVNLLLPPVCTCLTPLARTTLIQQFLLLRRITNKSRKEVLSIIGLNCPCCISHFKCSLLDKHPIYQDR